MTVRRTGTVVVGGAGLAAALAVTVAVAVAAATVTSGLSGPASLATGPQPSVAGEPATGATGIPAPYLADFMASAGRFAVPWPVLAGIYASECDFGRSPLAGCRPGTENGAGAQGPGQFLAPTWRRGLPSGTLIGTGPPTTTTAQGYATDGDGDGVADAWDPADAIASTARFLAANGAGVGDVTRAVFAYNHDPTYVQRVMQRAGAYASAGVDTPVAPASASRVLAAAEADLGKPYQWGGAGPAAFDCSGLVAVVYRQVGLTLTHNAAAQYAETSAHPVPVGAVQAGDLVFFGSSAATIHHVGIAVGGGEMIDAPHRGAVVRVEPDAWPDLLAATRPLG